MQVKFLRHAKSRCNQRGLDKDLIASLALAAEPMLNGKQALRFRYNGHVVVAQKRKGAIEIITAWQKPKRRFN